MSSNWSSTAPSSRTRSPTAGGGDGYRDPVPDPVLSDEDLLDVGEEDNDDVFANDHTDGTHYSLHSDSVTFPNGIGMALIPHALKSGVDTPSGSTGATALPKKVIKHGPVSRRRRIVGLSLLMVILVEDYFHQ